MWRNSISGSTVRIFEQKDSFSHVLDMRFFTQRDKWSTRRFVFLKQLNRSVTFGGLKYNTSPSSPTITWCTSMGHRADVKMNHRSSPAKAYDFLLKFLLVGDSDVGKGEILASLQDGSSESPYGYNMGKTLYCLINIHQTLYQIFFLYIWRLGVEHEVYSQCIWAESIIMTCILCNINASRVCCKKTVTRILFCH